MGAAPHYALFSAQYPPHLGGIESFTRNVARTLVARGARVTVVTNDTESMGEGVVDEQGVRVVRLACAPLLSGRLPLPRPSAARRALLPGLRESGLDGVLVNARFYPHSLLGMRCARACGLAPVVLDHGSAYLSFSSPVLDPAVRLWEDALTALGRRHDPDYYGISQSSARWLGHFGIQARGVIPNAIDVDAYVGAASGRDFRAELALAPGAPLVAFVGRLIPEKGVAALVEASRDPRLAGRGVTFAVAGDGPLADEVRAAEGPGLRMLGRLGSPDVAALLLESQALCLPSRSEGFSTTLLEAAACGCPPVVTDVGGAHEVVADPRMGAILPDASAQSVVRGVLDLLDAPVAADERSRMLRHRAAERFSWGATAALLEEAFERAAAR